MDLHQTLFLAVLFASPQVILFLSNSSWTVHLQDCFERHPKQFWRSTIQYLEGPTDNVIYRSLFKLWVFFFQVSNKFAFSLFDLDWDIFGAHIEGACNRVPVIAETGVKSTVCGPESFTADHKPLMGEAPELRGFYHGCGFNSAGIMLAGGCGRELARWVVHGHPELDMYGYDIR